MKGKRMKRRQTMVSKIFGRRTARLFVFLALYIGINALDAVTATDIDGLAALVGIIFFAVEFYLIYRQKKSFVSFMENFDFCLSDTTGKSLVKYPSPVVIIGLDGEIKWYNGNFTKLVGENETFGTHINTLLPTLEVNKLTESRGEFGAVIELDGRTYEVEARVTGREDKDAKHKFLLLYFIDKSDEYRLAQLREEEKTVEAIVIIDNYEEVLKETPDSNHGKILGEIEQTIGEWIALGDGVFRKFERDKFLVLFEQRNFEKILEDKFEVLNNIKNINAENKIPVTISIGIGQHGIDPKENDSFARFAVDMALGRGGDQVVIKDRDSLNFFGAKSREVEKRTKVKARVVAHALRKLIDSSGKVLIMGHKSGDMDSIGASIGLFKAVKTRNRKAYIVVDKETVNAKETIAEFEHKTDYIEAFITTEQAMNTLEKDSLVIVVDTHRPNMVECPELLRHADNIVLIDHHRRSENCIENATLMYHEAYASSTCEMVTEIIQYIQEAPMLDKQEAEALYAGIFMDTNGFVNKAGVRTFEAASYLKRMGVDTIKIRRRFKCDKDIFIRKAQIISNAEFYRDNIAISVVSDEARGAQVMCAQAADELLDIKGVEAAFVLLKRGKVIYISARSLDDINVQIIMEKLGGGGHITLAGAQMENMTLEEAVEKLHWAIDEVVANEE
ncbi:MAG: DHH family phosphoesterase [Clostridia bacterium]|nr:DHH family phosphoesterase [Clostridia bacterium]